MSQGLHVNLNGSILPATERLFPASNRSFRYGDGLFETIRHAKGKTQFIPAHIERIKTSMEVLKMDLPKEFTVDFLRTKCSELVDLNRASKGARIRLTFYRNDGGYYTPESNKVSWLLECEPIEESLYNLNAAGHVIDIFPDYKKQIHRLSNIKCNNAEMSVLAAIYKKENNLDDCVILNTNFSIAEGISGNVFAVKNGVLYTPPISDGCVDGIMRKQIIEVAKKHRISVYEVSLAMNVLLNSDELFLSNVVSGLSWISAYKAKRFTNSMSKLLVEKLNESLE